MKIEQTARGKAKDLGTNNNVKPTIVSMKRVDIGHGKTKNGSRERWDVEFEGLGNTEVVIEVPAKVNNLKNAAKRDEKVKALVAKAVAEEGNARLAAHL